MAKFLFKVSTGYVGSQREEVVEIEDEEFEGLNEQEIENLVDEYYNEWMQEKINCSWTKIED
jgi:hypothetical protein